MVVLKRKAGGETKLQTEYDSVIELDDRKSFAASQKEIEEIELYSPRESFVQPRKEVMPVIKKETKPAAAPATKEAISSKAKVLLAAYIIIAVVLAAVVLGTGLALTEIGNRNTEANEKIIKIETQIDEQNGILALVDDLNHIAGRAMTEFNMEFVDETVEIILVPEISTPNYGATRNWFDKLCDFLSNLFG